jgi:ferrochelatase
VEQTAQAVVDKLNQPELDWNVCYQSKVGPLEWIGPSTDDEIMRAGKENQAIMIIPIAFVSEHSETLVELDIEYKELADEHGVPSYIRVPALGAHQKYSESLASMVRQLTTLPDGTATSHTGKRLCPPEFTQCPCRNAA